MKAADKKEEREKQAAEREREREWEKKVRKEQSNIYLIIFISKLTVLDQGCFLPLAAVFSYHNIAGDFPKDD